MNCRELFVSVSLFMLAAWAVPPFLYSAPGTEYAFAETAAKRAILSVKVRGLSPGDRVVARQEGVDTPIPMSPVDPLTGIAMGSEARLVPMGKFCIVQVRVERLDPREQSGGHYPTQLLAGLDHAWVGPDIVIPFDIVVHPVAE